MTVMKCPTCGGLLNVPEPKGGMGWVAGCAIAGAAGFVVLFVVGLLAAIAIPSFVKARAQSQQNACINNLRQLDAAKAQFAMEHESKDGDAVPEGALAPYLGRAQMSCPQGGTYIVNPVGQPPACSKHGPLGGQVPSTSNIEHPTFNSERRPANE